MRFKKIHLEVAAVMTAMAMSGGVANAGDVELSGIAEVEANFTQDAGFNAGTNESDIVLATIELGVDANVSKDVSTHVLFLYEEDDTSFGVDEGTMTVKLSESASLTAGKKYVPFGSFDTHMISDPLTLELGETNETVVQVEFGSGAVSGSVYAFNGDSIKTGDDETIAAVGANVGVSRELAGGELGLGLSYISNLADSDALQENGTDAEVADTVPGVGFIATWGSGPMSVIAEYVGATTSFAASDLGGSVGVESQPTATNIEIAYEMGNGYTVAAGYQATSEAVFTGLPEDGFMVSVATDVAEGASLAVEYSTMNDYSVADGGTGESSSNLLFQMAVEF